MFKVYLLYISATILGWLLGQNLSSWVVASNDFPWLRALFAIGIGGFAIKQATSISQRLGDIQSIEGLTSEERSRLKSIVFVLKKETLLGWIIVILGSTLVVITPVLNTNIPTSIVLAFFFALSFFSILLAVRMHWILGNQIDNFKAKIKHRLEDKEKKKAMLDKLGASSETNSGK